MTDEFDRDNTWQRRMRDALLVPLLYERDHSGFYELIDHKNPRAAGGVDTIVRGTAIIRGKIDEKIVRWPECDEPYDAYALETDSCTIEGRERRGWMETNEVDWLLYCFADKDERALTCHLIPFPSLRAWFWPRALQWPLWTSTQINRTQCRIVPFADVARAVTVKIRRLAL